MPQIEKMLKYCITKEMAQVDERKDARKYARNRPRTPSSGSDANKDLVEVRSSLYNLSASPSKSPSPNKRTAASPGKLGSTAMRSLGGSSDVGTQKIGGATLNLVKIQTSAGPTKSALKALDNTGKTRDPSGDASGSGKPRGSTSFETIPGEKSKKEDK